MGEMELLGDLQGRANRVSRVDGVSDIASTCQLSGSVGGGFIKEIMASAHLSVSAVRKLYPSPHLDIIHISSSLYATDAFQAATLVLELRSSESE